MPKSQSETKKFDETSRVLLISQQVVSRNGNIKGDIFYESSSMIVSRTSKMT